MVHVASLGEPTTRLTVQEELRRRGDLELAGAAQKLAFLEESGTIPAYVPRYAAIIREKAALRELIQVATKTISDAFDDHDKPLALLEEAKRALAIVTAKVTTAQDILPVESLAELMAADIPERTFHVDQWLVKAGISFIVGDSEAYKSWLANYLGICKAAGLVFFDRWQTHRGPALIISEENGRIEDRRRLALQARGLSLDAEGLPLWIASERSFNFDDVAKYARLRAMIRERRIELLIVDSFVRVHRRKEGDSGEMSSLYMEKLRPIIQDGCDLVLLHHKRKLPAGLQGSAAASSENDDIRGSGDIRAFADAVLFLKNLTKDQVVVRQNKTRGWRKQDAFVFKVEGDSAEGRVTMKYEGKPEDVLDKSGACREAILAYAQEHVAGFTRAELEHHFREVKKGGGLSYSRKVFDPMLEKLSTGGYPLKKDEYGTKKKRAFYRYVVDEGPEDLGAAGAAAEEPGADDVPF